LAFIGVGIWPERFFSGMLANGYPALKKSLGTTREPQKNAIYYHEQYGITMLAEQ